MAIINPKAFASDTVPKTLADREELSAHMALMHRLAEGDFEGFKQVRFDVEESDDEFELIPANDSPRTIARDTAHSSPKLSNRQRKKVRRGIQEMVAGDRVLQAIAFNAAVATDHMIDCLHPH